MDGEEHEVLVPYYGGFIGQWGHTGHTEGYLKRADVLFCGTHKHDMIVNRDVPYEFTYLFCTSIDIPKGARELILPDDPRIVVFAATVASDPNNAVTPACDLLRVSLPEKGADEGEQANRNLAFDRLVVARSGEVSSEERAECALDDNAETKWCDVSGARPKYITVDLGKVQPIRGWYVMHAGLESLDYITKEYSLEVCTTPDGDWQRVDTVRDNTSLETDRLLATPVEARYVRLLVTKPDQSEGNTTRIYEFSVY